jgi:hypothetical protein
MIAADIAASGYDPAADDYGHATVVESEPAGMRDEATTERLG